MGTLPGLTWIDMDDGHNHPNASFKHMALTESQAQALIALERTGGVLSMIGVSLIFVAYSAFKRLRTVPNLFIVFASVANVGASIACLMGYDGIEAGQHSALCQAQAFLLEMFMQSDPWWSFAMAVNVFLVFFFGANPAAFRKHLWIYCVVCFGVPFIPALVCLLLKDERGSIYGDATLWCWIGASWNSLRIYTYYMPIWICNSLSALIYLAVGHHVFHQRNQLRNLTFSNNIPDAKGVSASDFRDSGEKNLAGRQDFYGTAVTEVQITTARQENWTPPGTPSAPPATASSSHHPAWADEDALCDGTSTNTLDRSRFETICVSNSPPPKLSNRQKPRSIKAQFLFKLRRLDPIKLAYLRTSFVFAISVLVTWTPSSINRVHSLIYPDQVNYGLTVASGVVLPLQGVWNAVIFFTTSWVAFREEIMSMRRRRRAKRHESRVRLDGVMIDTTRGDSRRLGRPIFERFRGQPFGEDARDLGVTHQSGTIRAMRGSF